MSWKIICALSSLGVVFSVLFPLFAQKGHLLNGPQIIFYVVYVIYYILERKTTRPAEKTHNYFEWTRYLMFFSWNLILIVTISESVFIKTFNYAFFAAGIIISCVGIIIRIYSKLTLREYFDANITVKNKGQLCERGLYRYIRHPGYLGSMIQGLGMPMILNAYIGFPVVCLFLFAVFIRIHYEEKFLGAELSGYSDYMSRTKRLIPGVY